MTTITELTDEQIGDIYKTEFAVEDPGSSFVIRFARAIITASRAKSAALSTPATAPEQCWCDEHGIGEPGVSCGDCPTRDYKSPATAPEHQAVIVNPIPVEYQYHYPDGAWRCSNGLEINGSKPTASRALYAERDKQ